MEATLERVQCKNLIAAPSGRIRPVFCVVAHAYQERAIADDACVGIFTNAGLRFEVGTQTDWLSTGLAEDAEWRIGWSKFYFGLNLAHTFAVTGKHEYLRTWEQLLRSWIKQIPVGFDTADVEARRIQNWIYSWNVFVASPHPFCFSEGFENELVISLSEQITHLRQNLTPERNHRTLELYALFIAALALPDLDEDRALLSFAMEELHHNLLQDFRADGVHREQSTHYHMTVLRSFLGALENTRRFSLRFPDSYEERLLKACEFALHCHRPDGLIPAFSDSDTGSYVDLLELAGDIFTRPDFLYVASSGAKGCAPEICNPSFAEGGYFIQRSGWGEGQTKFQNERYLIFDCGPVGDGGHGHYDLLSVEACAHGRVLVVDPGRYTYSEYPPNWRRWFKGTAAHNTVCVDGLNQTPYRNGKPKVPAAQGRLVERLMAPDFDLLCGKAHSPSYDAVHTRRVFFIANEYWLIVDQLRGIQAHRFDLRFHLAAEAWEKTSLELHKENIVARAPGVALVFDGVHQAQLEDGWVAPLYGVKFPAPVVSVTSRGVKSADFFTLVFPLSENEKFSPTLRLRTIAGDNARPLMLAEISGVGSSASAIDRIVWGAGCYELGPFSCRAAAAWLRETVAGDAMAFRACNVEELEGPRDDRNSSPFSPPKTWVAWDKQSGFARGTGVEL